MSRLDLSRVDVIEFLEQLGVQNIRENGDEVEYSCPFPGHSHGDTKPSATMQKGTTVFYCFTCHSKGNAVQFLSTLEGVPPWKARTWIAERWNVGFREPQGPLVDELMGILDKVPHEHRKPQVVLDEHEAEVRAVDWQRAYCYHDKELPGPLRYAIERGFSANALLEWEIGYDRISDRITIPVRNEKGKLVGFKGRAWMPEQKPRYLVLGDRHKDRTPRYSFEPYEISRVLYGLHRVLPGRRVVVCEGELNVVALWDAAIQAVAVSGSRLTRDQELLLRERCDHAVLWFDPGDAGEIGLEDACSRLVPHMRVSYVPMDEVKQDAAELPVGGRIQAVASAVSAVRSLVG